MGGDDDGDNVGAWAISICQGIAGFAAFKVTWRSGVSTNRLRLTLEERFLLLSSLVVDFGGSDFVDSNRRRAFGGCCAFKALLFGEGVSGSIPWSGDAKSDNEDSDWSTVGGGVVVNDGGCGFSFGQSFFGDEINRDFAAGSGL